ncbi:MAG: hypothetical protein MUQ10_18450 [Anaerolineae bacterium]|nr:hypothetical protein [Anaerolineae bacterium]
MSDIGEGIPSDVLPHIFETFVTTKVPGRGSDPVLAQVDGIVKQRDGHVTVSSDTVLGTVFNLYLWAGSWRRVV